MGYEADLKLFIDGVWKSGEGRDAHTVINPATGGGMAEVPYATAADLFLGHVWRRRFDA